MPVSALPEPLFEIDAVTSLMVGLELSESELYSVGGFTFDWTSSLSLRSRSLISGDDSVCKYDGGKIFAVALDTCIWAVTLASWDHETKTYGPTETKIIQFVVTN